MINIPFENFAKAIEDLYATINGGGSTTSCVHAVLAAALGSYSIDPPKPGEEEALAERIRRTVRS